LRGARIFDEVHRYYYRGRRRSVVCWDEAIAFNRPVVFDGDNMLSLAKAIRRQSSDAAAALLDCAARLTKLSTGEEAHGHQQIQSGAPRAADGTQLRSPNCLVCRQGCRPGAKNADARSERPPD
jgi:hypothetical protein